MRNLGLRAVHNIALPNANLSAVAIDLEEDAIYVTSERQNADTDIEVEIFKLESQENGAVQVWAFRLIPTVIGSRELALSNNPIYFKLDPILQSTTISSPRLPNLTRKPGVGRNPKLWRYCHRFTTRRCPDCVSFD